MEPVKHLIAFWAAESGAGQTTLVQAVASSLRLSGASVLELRFHPNASSAWAEPAQWTVRFQSLSPAMLRNALRSAGDNRAILELAHWPEASQTRAMLELLRRSFDWILVDGSCGTSSAEMAALESADLLLWVATSGVTAEARIIEGQKTLAAHHFPEALSKVVLNRLRPDARLLTVYGGLPVLAAIPESTPERLTHEGSRLAERLENSTNLFLLPASAKRSAVQPLSIQVLKDRVQPQLLEALERDPHPAAGPADADSLARATVERCLAQDATVTVRREEREQLYKRVLEDVLGLGPLEPLLQDATVSEIMVNGAGVIFVERQGRLYPVEARFDSEASLRTAIDRIVSRVGRRVDESSPLCDARLADGSRVNVVLPPLALDGPVVTIRKFSASALGVDALVQGGSLSAPMATLLACAVEGRRNIVVSGGTGSGKTTLLNALSGLIPDRERIVTIEDAAELRLQKPHVVRLESRPANAEGEGAVPIRRLVMNALRMRPDRIVIGECRGGEALDMLQAMNTGHDGSLTTLHANTPRDALARFETLVLMAGMDLPVRVIREQIRSAVHLVVQQTRFPDGSRRVSSITEVTGMEGDILTTQELFRFRDGTFESTGMIPSFLREGRA
jgi:pilus assembly protein CpaF